MIGTSQNERLITANVRATFGVLLTYTMQWDIMEANYSDAKNEESDALTYAFVRFIKEQAENEPKNQN